MNKYHLLKNIRWQSETKMTTACFQKRHPKSSQYLALTLLLSKDKWAQESAVVLFHSFQLCSLLHLWASPMCSIHSFACTPKRKRAVTLVFSEHPKTNHPQNSITQNSITLAENFHYVNDSPAEHLLLCKWFPQAEQKGIIIDEYGMWILEN